MTYAELLEHLKTLDREQLNQNVTIYVESIGEFYPVQKLTINLYSDVLDVNHPFLEV